MKKLIIVGALFAFGAFADEWKGFISDAKCGAKHAALTDKDVACIKGCVKGGSKAVFVVGDKVIQVANQDKVIDHLGHKVVITGKLAGDTVTVDSVKMQ